MPILWLRSTAGKSKTSTMLPLFIEDKLFFPFRRHGFQLYLGAKTFEVFLCFVAIVRVVRVYYVDFFVFFVLRHW